MGDSENENESERVGSNGAGTEQTGLPTALLQSPLTANLAPVFLSGAAEWTERWASRVVEDERRDRESRRDYEEMHADHVALYLGQPKKASKGTASGETMAHVPLLAKILNRYKAGILAMVNSAEPVPVPTGEEDIDRSKRLAQHLAWERRFKYPDWLSGFEETAVQCGLGSAFRYVGWDPVAGKRVMEPVPLRDFVMAYTEHDCTPDLRDVDHYTRTLRWPKWKILRAGRSRDGGVPHFYRVDELFSGDERAAEETMGGVDDPTLDEVKTFIGEPHGGKTGRYKFLERHGWEILPDEIDRQLGGTGVPRRMAIVIEASTKRVVRIVLMEDESPIDKLRHHNDMRALEAERDAEAERLGIPQEQWATLPLPRMPEPIMTEPVFPYFHYPFMRSGETVYGIGIGGFVGPSNQLANELATEDIVGARVRNTITGWTPKSSGAQKGEVPLKIGVFNEIEGAAPGELDNYVKVMEWPQTRGELMQWARAIDEQAQAAMSSSDQQSGMPGPSHETKFAAQFRAASAATAMTSAMEMFLVSLAAEFKFYARLNAAFLTRPEIFYTTKIDPATATPIQMRVEVSPEDYQADYDITFEADVRYEVDPGLGDAAMQAYGLLTQAASDPALGQAISPGVKLAALKKALRATRARDLAALLPDEVPAPPPPAPMSQGDELAGFMNEQDHPVLPDDDDAGHLAEMDEFERAGLYNSLSYTARQMHDRHKRGHQAAAFQKANRLRQQVVEMSNVTSTLLAGSFA